MRKYVIYTLFVFIVLYASGCASDPIISLPEPLNEKMRENEIANIEENPGETDLFTPGLE
ncbi:MAG: hypothetical protein P9M13_01345 [Candidatus Ancaeobacter aquaticus]|nr:hypothetical protein [Candidatus Ancaeobacter aquaticus]